MNIKLLFFVFVVGMGFYFHSCKVKKNTAPSSGTNTKPLTILLSDSGKTFRIKVNEKFNVAFGECIGCAEVWQIDQIDVDKITKLPNTYSGNSCKNCSGGSQVNTFHFLVKSAGPSTLSFNYFKQNLTVIIEGF